MKKKLTVIFDFDGTLANTMDLVFRLYNEHIESFNTLPVSKEELPKLRKLGYKNAMKSKKIRWTVLPRIALFLSREMKQHMDEVDPYPEIVETLEDLQDRGIRIGVLTSNNLGLVEDFFRDKEFPVFDFVVSEKTIFGKEKALKKIMKRHELNPEEVVYVGDEPRDITSCRKAGIKVIGVTWGFGGVEGLAPTPPDKLVHDARELHLAILDYAE